MSKVYLNYQRNNIALCNLFRVLCLYSDSLLKPLPQLDRFARLSINAGIDASDNINFNEKIKRIFSLGKLIKHINLR